MRVSRLRGSLLLLASLFSAAAPTAARAADAFAGDYRGEKLSVVIASGNDAYTGTIRLGSQTYPLVARATDGRLLGSFISNNMPYSFVAQLQGDTLTLVSGGETYTMKRQASPGAGAAPADATDVPNGCFLVRATASGKAMSVERDKVTNVRDSLEAVLHDLDDYFDSGGCDITGSFENQRDHRSGVATISAKYKGEAVKGFVATKLRETGSVAVVVFCTAKATQAEWDALTGATPGNPAPAGAAAGAPAEPAPPAAPTPELKEYRFADGSGSVGLPKGWHTDANSCRTTVIIDGPAGQRVVLGGGYQVYLPNSGAARFARHYGNGGRVVLVSEMVDPAEAVQTLMPQLSAFEKQAGRTAVEADHVAKVQDLTPIAPNGKMALVSWGVTHAVNGEKRHYQCMAQVSVAPINNDSWQFWFSQALAPDETARGDIPVMSSIISSWRINDQIIQKDTKSWLAQSNSSFAAQQQAQNELTKAYERQRADQVVRERRNADFDETIRAYRDVEDTGNGHRRSVDLGNVTDVVKRLNYEDPGRYKEIRLGDKVAPQPPR